MFAAILVTACVSRNKSAANKNGNSMNSYESEWAEIEQLRQQGLPQSLLPKVDSVYRTALAEKNYGQLIKSLIFKMNGMGIAEEQDKGANAIFRMLKENAERLPQPAQSVVYSMIAQMYEDYYSENAWTIHGRTNVATADGEDVQTWDARRLAEEAVRYYLLSLQEREALQNEPVDSYRDILVEGYDPACQPTLYDLLARRALAYFSSTFNVHNLPQQVFVVNDPACFADARTFAGLDIQTADSLSPGYLSLKIYQELLRFHIEKSGYGAPDGKANDGMTALIDADLRRMAFLRERGRYADNDKMYENALVEMSRNYAAYTGNAKVLLQLANFYSDRGKTWRYDKREDVKPGYAKAFQLCEQMERDYPGQLKDNVKALRETILKKELDVCVEETQLPGKPFLALLKFRNMDALHQITYELTEREAINCITDRKYDAAGFLSSLKGKPVRKRSELSAPADFQYYTTEIGIDPLEKGFHLVVFADTEQPTASAGVWTSVLIQTSSLMAYDRTLDNIRTIVVTDRESGALVPGARIAADGNTASVSDKNGIASCKENDGSYRRSHYTVTCGDEKLLVFSSSYGWRHEAERERAGALLFTDRSIYRPGQTAYFKAILFRPDGDGKRTLLRGETVTVRFRDVNGQVISEKALTSNDFGSVDGSFTIPQGRLNGVMMIECPDYASVAISVEEYKRPAFEVKFDPVGDNFALNGRVKVTASAKALAGYPVDRADVRYRVVRNMNYRYYYGWFPPAYNDREIASGVLQTDGEGGFSVEFDALADDVTDDRLIYTYTVTADVTDLNGETRSASLNVYAGKNPLLVNTNLPDKVAPGKLDGYTVQTTNLNGDFTPASVVVEIVSLRQPSTILRNRVWQNERPDFYTIPEDEFRKEFPLDAYGDELNPANFREAETVARYTLETAANVKLDLSSLKQSGYYRVKLAADNHRGAVAENIRHVRLSGGEDDRICNMNMWTEEEKATAEPGENVELRIAGGMEKAHVYYELIHRNRVVETRWITAGATPTAVSCPVGEEHRGGFAVQLSMIRDNRKYSRVIPVEVPYTNKMLDVRLATFRDKLLPGENETWTMRVSDRNGNGEAAEVAASLYDASLDAFRPHRWPDIYAVYHQQANAYMYLWTFGSIERYARAEIHYGEPPAASVKLPDTDARLNWFDRTYLYAFNRHGIMALRSRAVMANEAPVEYAAEVDADEVVVTGYGVQRKEMMTGAIAKSAAPAAAGQAAPTAGLDAVQTRTNFNETAFFYPRLRTDGQGGTLIEFTIPEALTRWRLLSFAHTKDFRIGSYTNELVTRKEVAISAGPPRFFREGDVIRFTARVNNLTDADIDGQAQLRVYDAMTMQPVDGAVIRSEKAPAFGVKAGGSAGLGWTLAIPEGLQAITYRVTARAGAHTDGEEKTIPVLTSAMLVTETLPFSVRAGREKTLTFDRLADNRSETLRNHRLTLEFTSAPAWYAVQALPYIMEYPYECAEQTFSRFYANSLAATIANSTPRIRQIFDLWKTSGDEALASALEKNGELKQVVLEETPWVMQAKNESERRKRLALLFDLNRMSNEMARTFDKLSDMQSRDGGFPWFEGQPSSRYITQHIVAGLAHLEKLNAMPSGKAPAAARIVRDGLAFLDGEFSEDYKRLTDRKANMAEQHITDLQLHYLYACSFSGHRPDGKQQGEAFDFWLKQAGTFWKNFTTYGKAMAALALHRNGRTAAAAAIVRSLKEYAQQSEELGMYWKDNVAGRFWYQAPTETQAMLIEAFDEVASDTAAVEEMKIWLLRNKQTNDWKTTKATAEAVYALLMTGASLLDESELPEIELAGKPLAAVATEAIRPEPGTGYVKTSWQGSEITARMGSLKVKNPNRRGILWGGMYWQYFERLDRIAHAETGLKMNRQLFLRTLAGKGETLQPAGGDNRLHVGDLVRVRLELRADRDYEYVHLKDMRAACLEPVSVLSGNRYQDGLWYYESVKDASVNFFIHYLPAGVYVFEYDLRVSHAGDFSNGITTFQCMYAPEFSAHSEGIRVTVDAPDSK
jgi:hypothetical protein